MKKQATLFWITLFSIAMGLFECIVVIYLRKIYYPEGFDFPLKMMDSGTIGIELLRESATLIMLAAIGIITGRTKIEKFGWFLYAFAIWDIFYYIFLKLLIGWPQSMLSWDILFLIPVTWIGPVLAPVINSITMIVLAWLILGKTKISTSIIISTVEWVLLIIGSVIVIISYTIDYIQFMIGKFDFSEFIDPVMSQKVTELACSYIPIHFPWGIYGLGVLLHLAAVGIIGRRRFKS